MSDLEKALEAAPVGMSAGDLVALVSLVAKLYELFKQYQPPGAANINFADLLSRFEILLTVEQDLEPEIKALVLKVRDAWPHIAAALGGPSPE